jgi:protocatechuate 3,4-dioxygenase beta subunit
MSGINRRQLLGAGLAVLGVEGLVLRADAQPTPSAGTLDELPAFVFSQYAPTPLELKKEIAPTEDCILGPYYRKGAPFRGKVTPPLEPGVVLLITGRVWGHDTKKPLSGARLDIWQANAAGRYDNDDPKNPPKPDVFINRCRLIADENGLYEYETVHPGPYQIGPMAWRPSHIHYLIQATGYKPLITQLFFDGDKFNEKDDFIKPSLIIKLGTRKVGTTNYEVGSFDIVLAKA